MGRKQTDIDRIAWLEKELRIRDTEVQLLNETNRQLQAKVTELEPVVLVQGLLLGSLEDGD